VKYTLLLIKYSFYLVLNLGARKQFSPFFSVFHFLAACVFLHDFFDVVNWLFNLVSHLYRPIFFSVAFFAQQTHTQDTGPKRAECDRCRAWWFQTTLIVHCASFLHFDSSIMHVCMLLVLGVQSLI
jgi:hypothetical protein